MSEQSFLQYLLLHIKKRRRLVIIFTIVMITSTFLSIATYAGTQAFDTNHESGLGGLLAFIGLMSEQIVAYGLAPNEFFVIYIGMTVTVVIYTIMILLPGKHMRSRSRAKGK